MTVTAIHPPSKLLDLDAVVRSVAVLTGAGLVGVITAGPAKLALLRIAGGAGHVIDLSVDSPQDLALLSKDVAVVRAGDGSLWAISDLAGSPRARLVARDVRALDMRPQGESAIALLHDGSAGAISLHRQEVSMRSFSVRGGALRACSVGEHVTWVVIDGDRGAELRIHPGATPELGTSAKTTLPAEAAELDQLRGGSSLSVLFKRGMTSACAITGTPNKLVSRMVELEGRPADVAVVGDDTLLVAYGDGRVSLYDVAAIAGAGRGPMSATFGYTPLARGKPRVAVVVLAAKSAPALWIGTTSGEVLRAELALDGEKVEEPPPPKSAAPREEPPVEPPPPESAAPREDLGAALAAAKEALAASEALREAESARARALEDERASHVVAIEALKSEHASTLEAQSTAYAASVGAQGSEYASSVEALEAKHAAALEAQKAEHGHQLEAQKAEHASAIETLKAEYASATEAQEAEHASAIEALKAERASVIETLKAEHASATEALKSEHGNQLDAQNVERASAIEALKTEHASATEALKAEHASAIEAMKAESSASVEALKAEHGSQLEAQKAERDALRAELDLAHKEIEALVARARAAEQSAHERARARAEAEAELSSLRAEISDERAKLDKDFVKWGDRTIPLDRARGALDSVLSRAQGVFGKRKGD